jgi:phosphoenolpyruvate carboxykinase (ATP)
MSWSGGPYGIGQRIKLPVTRAIVKAILNGALKSAEMKQDPIFGVRAPTSCPGVPSEVLDPRQTWKDTAAYDRKARDLAAMFEKNFKEAASDAPAEVREAGPKA